MKRNAGDEVFAVFMPLVVAFCSAVIAIAVTIALFVLLTPGQEREEFPPGIAIAALTGVAAAVAGFVFTHRKLA